MKITPAGYTRTKEELWSSGLGLHCSTLSRRSAMKITPAGYTRTKEGFTFANKTRYAILVLTTLCLSIIQSNTLTLNFTIICMSPPSVSALEEEVGPRCEFRMAQWRSTRFGPRKVVSAYGVVSALSTALIPASAGMGFYYLVVMRFLQGTALSVCLNIVAYVTGQWSMLKTNAVFIACLSGFYQGCPTHAPKRKRARAREDPTRKGGYTPQGARALQGHLDILRRVGCLDSGHWQLHGWRPAHPLRSHLLEQGGALSSRHVT
uniref:MFS domain-containing protein n=1 Tax=Steinernema glaseri TaxID=37863 RepID=A0A1I7Z8K4_9BILA